MKFNKWTLGLAAVGAVSLASVQNARADMNGSWPNNLSISGSVDTSIHWALDPCGNDFDNSPGAYIPYSTGKQDGFNLNKVRLVFEKPLDETPWASGFKSEFWFGPDANWLGTSPSWFAPGGGDLAIKQAYVELRVPVGNGINTKIGVFDTIIGYEASNNEQNPNYTRSWAYAIEPTQHEGILASYQFSDMFSMSAGVANTYSATIGGRKAEFGSIDYDDAWCKTWMVAGAFTAPESWGSFEGSSLYVGAVGGFDNSVFGSGFGYDRFNLYAGGVINTPIEGLTTGIAYDYADIDLGFGLNDAQIHALGLYASYRATEKLSFHGRGEYVWGQVNFDGGGDETACGYALTGTVQYDLWNNVISRLELRYDHIDIPGFGGFFSQDCSLLLAANIIYVF